MTGEEIAALIHAVAISPHDRRTQWTGRSVGLAHFQKDILSEDRFDTQPLVTPDGRYALVTDAILQNREELAAEFGWKPADITARPDGEFALAAWLRWQRDCVRHLEGRYALMAWDAQERRLFCAVDALGFRPLYYWRQGGLLAFSTTLRGLFSLPAVSRELNESVFVDSFVRVGATSAETLYKDIQCVPAGHTLSVGDDHVRRTRYWQPWPSPELPLKTDADYTEAFRAEFTRAVKAGLRTSGQIGVRVSGGLDSAAVTAVAGRLLAEQGRRLQAFHHRATGPNRYRMPAGRELDESRFVEAMQVHSPEIDFHFIAPARRVPLPEHDDEPDFSDHWVPAAAFWLKPDERASPAHAELVTLMLNGLGGNFLVSPETRPTGYLGSLAASGQWWRLLREARGHRTVYRRGWRELGREIAAEAGWRQGSEALPRRLKFLRPELVRRTGIVERLRAEQAEHRQLLRRDFRASLAWMLTRMVPQSSGAALAVVSRQPGPLSFGPMFDRRLNEFCLAAPVEQQFRQGWDRRLLREAMRGLLPESVRLRTSRGLPQPEFQFAFELSRERINGVLRDFPHSPAADWFDHTAVGQLVDRTTLTYRNFGDEAALIRIASWTRFLRWLSAPPANASPRG